MIVGVLSIDGCRTNLMLYVNKAVKLSALLIYIRELKTRFVGCFSWVDNIGKIVWYCTHKTSSSREISSILKYHDIV